MSIDRWVLRVRPHNAPRARQATHLGVRQGGWLAGRNVQDSDAGKQLGIVELSCLVE